MNLLLDTSVIISFLIKDKHTAAAEKIFITILEGKVSASITSLILVEVCGVLRRVVGKETAELALAKLNIWISKGILSVFDQTKEIASLACSFAIDYGIKGADALIAATSYYHKLNLVTFDEELITKLKHKVNFYSS